MDRFLRFEVRTALRAGKRFLIVLAICALLFFVRLVCWCIPDFLVTTAFTDQQAEHIQTQVTTMPAQTTADLPSADWNW